eukprot:PhF_6_TR22341/c0_g1_i1/m.31633/K01062/PLA2G7, PAFAH; platelet-activating factor acetylhydrolase
MVRLHDLPVILGLSAAASAYLFYEDYSSTCIIIGTVAIGVKALIHGFFPIPKLSPLPGPRINFDIGIQHVKGVVGKHPPLSVFYPAEKSQSHSKQVYSWVPYGDRRYIDGLAHFIGIPSFVLNHMNGVKIMATINAKRASGKQKFIVFSHGLGGHQHMYSVLAMELVSQGYTVVCPQHLDGSACFALCHEDNLVHYRRPNTKDDKELKRIRQNQLEHRVQEIQEILENYVPKSESVILVGHSFGAATATAAGWSEELRNRVKKNCCAGFMVLSTSRSTGAMPRHKRVDDKESATSVSPGIRAVGKVVRE